ncbi:MAG: phosphatase PAP2 family protein [Planctomycetota bacterium]
MAVFVLLAVAFAADPFVAGLVTRPDVRPALEKIVGSDKATPLADQWLPLLIVLGMLLSLSGGGRRCIGLLAPVLLHLPILNLLKWAIGRMRPLADMGAYTFAPLSGAKYADAFPSGHTALPAIVALVLGMSFPRARWFLYVWAGVEGLKRMVAEMHWLSDVLAGYLLAGCVVWLCWRWLGPQYYGCGAGLESAPHSPTQTTSRRPLT